MRWHENEESGCDGFLVPLEEVLKEPALSIRAERVQMQAVRTVICRCV